MIRNFPFFTIVLSLLCAVIAFALHGKKARFVTYGLLSAGLAMTVSVIIYNLTNGSGYFVYRMGHYDAPIGNEIAAGLAEPVMLCLFEAVMLCSVIGGAERIDRDIEDGKHYYFYIMVNLLHAALAALCYTNDIFTGYVFVEICTISSCSLLMVRSGGKPLVAATRYMIFSLVGSSLFLMGVILLYAQTGQLLFPQLYEAVQELADGAGDRLPLTVSVGLMTLGLCIKSGLFPFHYWMPDTYGTATPAASGILSGVVSKGYIFLLIKVMTRVVGWDTYCSLNLRPVLYGFGLAAMIVGSVSAIRAKGIDAMTAYSSAAQIGYIYMGFGIGTREAIIASFFQIIAHALTKPLLFLCVSRLKDTAGGSSHFHDLSGSAHADRAAGTGFLIGSLSIIGIPLFAGFIPKLDYCTAAFGHGIWTYVTLAVLVISTMLNVIYFYRTVLRIYDKNILALKSPAPCARLHAMTGAMTALIVLNLCVGLFSQPIENILTKGIDILMNIR